MDKNRERIEACLGYDFFEKPRNVLESPTLNFKYQIGDAVTYKVWPGCLESRQILALAARCERYSMTMFISTNIVRSPGFDTPELLLTFCLRA